MDIVKAPGNMIRVPKRGGLRVSAGVRSLGKRLAAQAGIVPRSADTVRPPGYYLADDSFVILPGSKAKTKAKRA
jgi:hypothetical protein